jgi:hypothetical protein
VTDREQYPVAHLRVLVTARAGVDADPGAFGFGEALKDLTRRYP